MLSQLSPATTHFPIFIEFVWSGFVSLRLVAQHNYMQLRTGDKSGKGAIRELVISQTKVLFCILNGKYIVAT